MISRWLRHLLYWYHFYRHDGYVSERWVLAHKREAKEQQPWWVG